MKVPREGTSVPLRGLKTAASLAFLASAAFALAQAPPVLSTPYQCANGITYTVTICKPYGADQWCQWTEHQNGQLVTTVNSSWSSMTGRLKGCTVAGSPNSSTSAPSQLSTGAQQNFNPPYLKEFPSVDQVMARMQGKDAKDTANRQMGAFEQFQKILQDLAGSRWLRGQLTPDEARIRGNYDLAYNNLAKPLNFPDDGYFANPDFIAALFNTFPMPTVKQQWLAQNAALAARVKAASQHAGQDNTTQPTGSAPTAGRPLPPTNDPAQIAIRRCFELGGAGLQCVGAGMSVGMQQFLMGIDLNALKNKSKPGLIILGSWTSPGGVGFQFDHGTVGISCGLMVRGDHKYDISTSGGKYVINIANQPQPFLITITPDGRASGPAAEDITGEQVAGYTVTTNVRTGAVVSKVPYYKPITVHCSIGLMKTGPQFAVDPGLPSNDPSPGVLSAIGTVIGTMAGAPPPQLMLSPGPRMDGVFSGANGFKVQFNDGSAIVDCAQAHILTPYDVSMQGGVAVVSVKNAGNPFNLAVQPDGTLSGSGTTTIHGKIMTALNGADPIFAQTSASCPLNRMTASAK